MIIKIVKVFIVAALMVELMIYLLWKPQTPVYAIEQTVEALKNVRNLYAIKHNASGDIEVEMWIEIKPDGTQGDYFQKIAGKRIVMEDEKIQLIYLIKENVVLLDNRDEAFDVWLLEFNALFEEMAKDNSVTVKNISYNDQKFHMVQWPKQDITCFIDPDTKLPRAVERYEIYYEQWPKNIFDKVQILKTATVLDRRKPNKTANDNHI